MNMNFISERKADSANEWLTAAEAAQYLRVAPLTLLQWVRERKVPAHQISGVRRCVWRFLRPELDAMLGLSSAERADGRRG
jgi:excisionase family DNA binding protein